MQTELRVDTLSNNEAEGKFGTLTVTPGDVETVAQEAILDVTLTETEAEHMATHWVMQRPKHQKKDI